MEPTNRWLPFDALLNHTWTLSGLVHGNIYKSQQLNVGSFLQPKYISNPAHAYSAANSILSTVVRQLPLLWLRPIMS